MTDFERVLQALAAGSVEYILIGGLAANAHGAIRTTRDVDIVYARSRANLERLETTLAPLRPYLRGAPPGLPFRLDVPTLQSGLNFTLTTDLGELDLLGDVARRRPLRRSSGRLGNTRSVRRELPVPRTRRADSREARGRAAQGFRGGRRARSAPAGETERIARRSRLERLDDPCRVFERRPNEDVKVAGNRGAPWKASAYAPTTTNSTPWAVKDAMNSPKSGASSIDLPPQVFDSRDALCRRPRQPVAQVWPRPFFLRKRRQAHDSLQFRRHESRCSSV